MPASALGVSRSIPLPGVGRAAPVRVWNPETPPKKNLRRLGSRKLYSTAHVAVRVKSQGIQCCSCGFITDALSSGSISSPARKPQATALAPALSRRHCVPAACIDAQVAAETAVQPLPTWAQKQLYRFFTQWKLLSLHPFSQAGLQSTQLPLAMASRLSPRFAVLWGLSAGFDLSSDFCSRFCSLDLKASPSTGLSAHLAGIAHWGRCSHRSGWLPGQLRLQTSTQKARKHPIHTRKSVQGEGLNPAAWNAVVLPSGHSTHLRSKSKCSLQVVAAPQTPEPNPSLRPSETPTKVCPDRSAKALLLRRAIAPGSAAAAGRGAHLERGALGLRASRSLQGGASLKMGFLSWHEPESAKKTISKRPKALPCDCLFYAAEGFKSLRNSACVVVKPSPQ